MFRRLGLVLACLALPLWLALAQSESTQSGGAKASNVKLPAEQTGTYFKTIDELLATAKVDYGAGNTDAASEALIEAYLENFEYLEAPLEKVDVELVEELEEILRVDLPEIVNANGTQEEFVTAVDAALAELDRAQTLLK